MTPAPMLVSPARALPIGSDWVYEVKWNRVRALVSVADRIRVHSRHGRDHTAAFPELQAMGALRGRVEVVLDGELVCLDPATGRPVSDRLMGRLGAGMPSLAPRAAPVTFMAFDPLALDSTSTCTLTWSERRSLLQELYLATSDPTWRVNTAFDNGERLLTATAEMGLEGLVAQRTTSRYQPGRRGLAWRKFKHQTIEWFDLVGWRRPRGRDIGGLIAHESGRSVACAFPGLEAPERQHLAGILAIHGDELSGDVHLTTGVAEVEIAYLKWTRDGRLREAVARRVRLSSESVRSMCRGYGVSAIGAH